MILSICIPIYNTDIRPLATELHRQIQAYSSEVELLFLDDASDVFFKELNRSVGAFSDYQELPLNIGRSKIRNAFLPFVKGTHLLFLDGDSIIQRSDFIQKYLQFLNDHSIDLLVGGREETTSRPSRSQMLRWEYSRKRESKTTEERIADRTSGFKSNNFIVRKSIFEENPFDESIVKYGHEDTLFGFQLYTKGVVCHHIDNPIKNDDLVENHTFLLKTKDAVSNLWRISQKLQDDRFNQQQKLLRLALRIHQSKVIRLVFHPFGIVFQPMLSFMLTTGYFRLWMFDLYRLIELERIISKDITYQ
jgi:cellulose synthase/poly-beta-1,6-N-acetylglucosamine synthase-like glycosyltransferase